MIAYNQDDDFDDQDNTTRRRRKLKKKIFVFTACSQILFLKINFFRFFRLSYSHVSNGILFSVIGQLAFGPVQIDNFVPSNTSQHHPDPKRFTVL